MKNVFIFLLLFIVTFGFSQSKAAETPVRPVNEKIANLIYKKSLHQALTL